MAMIANGGAPGSMATPREAKSSPLDTRQNATALRSDQDINICRTTGATMDSSGIIVVIIISSRGIIIIP